jgi:hypothetical protein
MDERGSKDGACLSEEALWREARGGGGSCTGDPRKYDMIMAPDTGISLHRGPFTTEGNLESGGGLIYREL